MNFTYTKMNEKDNDIKLTEKKDCRSFQTKVVNIFQRSKWM